MVFSKYRKGDAPTKIFRNLVGELSLETNKRWCKMIDITDSIDLAYSSGRPYICPNAWSNWKGQNLGRC